MREAVIVSAVRTAVGKAPKGTLKSTRPDDLGAAAVRGALARVPNLNRRAIEDVIIGCAMPEAEQGMNVARIIALRAGLPVESAAMTVNRYCASGLQSIALAAERIRGGSADAIVAGGTESMSFVPFGGNKIAVNPWLTENYPDSYMSMGLTAERVAKHYGISREESDQFALASHEKALAAVRAGKFEDEIVSVAVETATLDGFGQPEKREADFRVDEGPRSDTSYDALAKLRPVFHAHGIVTAGNSSQTSDGAAAAVVVSEEFANSHGFETSGAIRGFCLLRMSAGGDGSRPRLRCSEGVKAGRADARPDRRDRIKRSLRRAVFGCHQVAGPRSSEGEREWWSDRPGSSAGLHRRETDGDNLAGTEAAQRQVWPGDDVCRRRHGRSGNIRESSSLNRRGVS